MDSNNVIRNALVKLSSNPKQTWRPKDKDLTFGKEGKIPVDGWFTGGVAATISWNGNDHILSGKSGFFAPTVTANGNKIATQATGKTRGIASARTMDSNAVSTSANDRDESKIVIKSVAHSAVSEEQTTDFGCV